MSLTLVPTAPAFTIVDAPQRSPAWFTARLGRLTGSRAGDMLATVLHGEAAKRRDLRLQLVLERLTGTSQEDRYVSPEMRRGALREPHAVAAYEARTGRVTRTPGFISHNALMVGCSPDGLIGDGDGVVEIKCPKAATHLRYLQGGTVPLDCLPQIVHTLWLTGAPWCDFVSFHPDFPPDLQTVLVRYERNSAEIAAYAQVAGIFLDEVDAELARVNGLRQEAA